MIKYTPKEIAESLINGNLSWVKEQLKKDVSIIAKVLNELEEEEKENLIKWVMLW